MKRYLSVLDSIQHMRPTARRRYLACCPKEIIECFSECALNILKGNVKLSRAQLQKLRREKNNLRRLSLKKTPLSQKRKIVQKGGFIGGLLAPVLSLLAPVVGSLFGHGTS